MLYKKFKAASITIIVSLSLIAGVLVSYVPAKAEGETNDPAASAVTNGLVAYWNFDDNYQESVGGLTTNLGASNLTYTEGIYGKAAVFSGVDNYLYVDANPVLNLGNSYTENNDNFSISVWVNLGDSKSGKKYLLDKGLNLAWKNNDKFYWSNPYRLYFDLCKPVVDLSNEFKDYNVDPHYIITGSSSTSGKFIEAEEWVLYTVTYDGKRVKMYQDNQLLMQNNYTNGIAFNNNELYIGTDCSLKNFFKGAVDDLRLYNLTLSFDDVNSLYQQGLTSNKELVEPTKQLVAYYPFDDNLKDESVFKNDAEKVEVSGTIKYVIGKNGKAITMSKGNYILVPAGTQLNFDDEFTVSFWLKVDEDGKYPVLYRQNPSYVDKNDNDWIYSIYLNTWNKNKNSQVIMRTRVYTPDAWIFQSGPELNSPFSYVDNKLMSTNWFHYAFTYKDGLLKSYLNGVLQKNKEMSNIVSLANASGDLLIGYDNNTFLNGAMDELKIFNKCLSETDVDKEAKRVDSICLSRADAKAIATISKGKSETISSVLLYDVDANGYITIDLSNASLSLKSSDTKIFTVKNGKITGVKAGKAVLTITYGCHSVSYNIKIK